MQVHAKLRRQGRSGGLAAGAAGGRQVRPRAAAARPGVRAGRRRPGRDRGRRAPGPPTALAGLLEVRGLGIVRLPYAAPVRLALAVDLGTHGERLPHARALSARSICRCCASTPRGPRPPPRVALALDCALRPRRPGRRGVRAERAGAAPTPARSCWSAACPAPARPSILRALEDLGFEAIDNPPLPMIEELVRSRRAGAARRIAVGVDARSRGFDAGRGARHARPAARQPGPAPGTDLRLGRRDRAAAPLHRDAPPPSAGAGGPGRRRHRRRAGADRAAARGRRPGDRHLRPAARRRCAG